MFVKGVKLIFEVVAPLLHKYVEAPLTVNVAVCPKHIVGEFTVKVGVGVTITGIIEVVKHEPFEPVTV